MDVVLCEAGIEAYFVVNGFWKGFTCIKHQTPYLFFINEHPAGY